MALEDRQVREKVVRVEGLLAELESGPEADARATATEALAALLELYGEALERILAHVERAGAAAVRDALARDEWVAQLLVLHGLQPESAPPGELIQLEIRDAPGHRDGGSSA